MARNKDLLRHELGVSAQEAFIQGHTIGGSANISSNLSLKITAKSKQAKINGKVSRLLSDYFGRFSAVTFSPSDLEIIRGAPEFRRNWIDRMACVYDPEHMDHCLRYSKVLGHRNKELRSYAQGVIKRLPEDFESWTEEMARLGAHIIHRRYQTVDKVKNPINRAYKTIVKEPSKKGDEIDIFYNQTISADIGVDAGQGDISSLHFLSHDLVQRLKKSEFKERIAGTTLVGPHRDDLIFNFNGCTLKTFGSQGEIRSTVLALRLAEVGAHIECFQTDPVLLIDDFSSELDEKRRTFLLNYLTSIGSQIFLSTTEKLNFGKQFSVHDGKVFVNGS